MSVADIIHFPRHAIAISLPKGWWLLPSIVVGAGIWAAIIYAIVT